MLAPPPAASDGAASAGGVTWQSAAGEAAGNAAQLAGMDESMQALREVVVWPIKYAKEAAALGLKWPSGVLLYGPPGTGKTLMVREIARECNAHLFTVTSSSIFGAYAGESERRLRDVFDAARGGNEGDVGLEEGGTERVAGGGVRGGSEGFADVRPSIVFIDEIDVLCPKRDSSPNALDAALRRPGRFDREIAINVPGTREREAILKLHARSLPLHADVDMRQLAARCKGYVGADLAAVCREAALAAVMDLAAGEEERGAGEGEELSGRREALSGVGEVVSAALSRVGPSVTRGVAAELPAVTWRDIGGLESIKKRLQMAVEWPLQHPEAFLRLALTPPRGVLLHGPPGGGKTMLALAAAHASKATLFSLSGADLFSMYVGEGEAMLKETFRLARMAAPSVVFVDEVDVVGGRSTASTATTASNTWQGDSDSTSAPSSSSSSSSVLVIAATNRFQALDPAIIRPGRFDSIIYVPPLDEPGRLHALQIHTSAMRLAADVSLPAVASRTALFTGADVAALCREAALAALRGKVLGNGEGEGQSAAGEDTATGTTGAAGETEAQAAAAVAASNTPPCVSWEHFDAALMVVRPSLTELEVRAYERDA
ncbi:unnamed protein product [Closterium sp. Yama58-4]|nr:unnamed protein product [Closterium sp. Yama58-4]